MATRRSNKSGGKSDNGYLGRRRRVVGAGTAAGAFLALGMTPLLFAPQARADFEWLGDLLDPLINSATTADLTDPVAWAWLDPAAHIDGATWFDQNIYVPIHTAIDDWINSSDGAQFAAAVNTWSGQFLIGDGVDGTASHPDGGDGGLLFGDGGDGYYGGNGGNAGWLIGDGGDAGEVAPSSEVTTFAALATLAPIDGTPGTAGDAALLFGNGGDGGNGADGQFGGNGGAGGAGGAGGLWWGNGGNGGNDALGANDTVGNGGDGGAGGIPGTPGAPGQNLP